MGAPGWTSFCTNGHIVEVCPHHGMIFDPKTVCAFCGAKIVCTETEWGDEDYGHAVPYKPIGEDTAEITTVSKYGRKTEIVKIPVYDVSKFLNKRT